MASSSKVSEWFLNNKPAFSFYNAANLFNTLAKIIGRINKIESNESIEEFDEEQLEFYAAGNLKSALHSHNWHMRSEEHDCHELFHLLMDILDEEQKERKNSLKSLNFLQSSNSLIDTNRFISTSSPKNPFHGYLASQLQCLDCDYKYPLRLESFYSLSLNLPTSKHNNIFDPLHLGSKPFITLYECINNYFRSEHITEMKCEKCHSNENESNTIKKTKKGFIKKLAIAKLPDCLCIQIQRNSWSDRSYEMIKQYNYVQFPLNIKIDNNNSISERKSNTSLKKIELNTFSLKQVCIGGLIGGKKKQNEIDELKHQKRIESEQALRINQSYALRSAIVHYGNAHSGHFVAFRRPLNNFDGDEWLQISDSDIKRVPATNLLSSNVYMLFYDKINSILTV